MVKKLGSDDIRKPVVDEVKEAQAPVVETPKPMALRKPLRPMKGDGITTEKPRLPSETNPDVAPRRPPADVPVISRDDPTARAIGTAAPRRPTNDVPVITRDDPTARAMAPRPTLPGLSRGLKGDGMTGKKPRLPGANDAPLAVPNGGFGSNIDPTLGATIRRGLGGVRGGATPKLVKLDRPPSWWSFAAQRRDPPLSSITTQQAISGPKIPDALVGAPADKFMAAFSAALKNGDGWAKELQAFGKQELARVERTARFSTPQPDRCGTNGSSTMGSTRDVAASHLSFCRANGEPWAIALSEERKASTFQAAVDGFRRAPQALESFEDQYRGAVTTGDPKALALQQQAAVQVSQLASSIQSASDFISPEAVDVQIAAQVAEAAQAGQPWAAAAHADQAAQIPNDLLPITEDNAPAFREAYRAGLEAGEPWAVELKQFAAGKVAELDKTIDRARATSKVANDQVFDDMRSRALGEAKAAGEPWVYAALADAAPPTPAPRPEGASETSTADATLPAEWPTPLPADRTDAFKAAFKDALKNDEPWARALIAEGQTKIEALEQKFEDLPGAGEVEGKGGLSVERRVATQVARAEKQGEPWAVALKAEGELRLEQAEQKKIAQATNTKFLALPPEVGVSNPKDHNSVRNQDAADGSMKVPSPKEAFVGEYVRTNAIVKQLREGGLANIYNPLYQQHLSATVEGAGRGEAPPAGKGFLALTNHGFAYCYDATKSPEHNSKIAELSLLSGMSFEQCRDARVGVVKHNDGKFEDALEVFKSFDPTKKGELKIALDGSGKGKVEIVITSDGNGGITSEHSKKPSTWTKIGRAVAQYGLPVAALVCAVVPGLQGVAAICISTASAVKSVVEGIKNKDWLGAVLGAVGAVGGVLQIAGKAAGATSALAATGSRISDAAKALEGVRGVIAGIKDKSLSATLLSVANVAGGLASVVPDAKGLTTTLEGIAKHAKQFGELAAFGEAGVAALKSGDYLGAFVAAVKLGASAGQSYLGLDPKVAEKLIQGAGVMKSVGDAVKNKDWTGAIATLLEGVKTVTGSDNKLLDAGATLAGVAQSLAHSDPASAAQLAMAFVGRLTSEKGDAKQKLEDPNTPAAEKSGLTTLVEGLDKQLGFFSKLGTIASGIGEVVAAVKNKDPAAILDAASSVVADLTKNGKIAAAHEVIAAARVAYEAAKSGDQISAMQAAMKLGAAIRTAIDSAHSDKKEPGTVPDPKAAITGTLSPAEAAAAEGYRVKIGDTLPALARTLLGDECKWPELYAYNRNVLDADPSKLSAGLKLELPPPGFPITAAEREAIIEAANGKLPATPPASGTPVAAPGTYTSRPGDSLSGIAKRLLGSSAKWPELYEYNKDLIGKDPNDLGVGETLRLPPAGFPLSDARRKEILALGKGPVVTPKPAETSGDEFQAMVGLREGATGANVKRLDEALHALGFIGREFPTQSTFTEGTAGALKAFQRKNGLPQSGEVDTATASALRTATANIDSLRGELVSKLERRLAQVTAKLPFYRQQASTLANTWTTPTLKADYQRALTTLEAAIKDARSLVSSANPDMLALQNREQTIIGLEQQLTLALSEQARQDLGSLNDDVKLASLLQTACDRVVGGLGELPGAPKAIQIAYNTLKASIREYYGSNGDVKKALEAGLREATVAIVSYAAGDTLGGLLKRLGKSEVRKKLAGVAGDAIADLTEDMGKALVGPLDKRMTAIATAWLDLQRGAITQAQYQARVSAAGQEFATAMRKAKATLLGSLGATAQASVARAFGSSLSSAEARELTDAMTKVYRGFGTDTLSELFDGLLERSEAAATAAAKL